MVVSKLDESGIEFCNESQERFDDDLVFGNFFKDLVVLILGKCGYEIYPYGYESYFPNLKRSLYESQSSDVAGRVRSTPDLLVRDPMNNEVNLVEVKARSNSPSGKVRIKRIDSYQKFWPEAVIVLVISFGKYFYAQHVSKLNKSGWYDPTQFRQLEEIFPRASNLSPDFQQKMAKKAKTLFRNRQNGDL